jgi:hypothetical protein
MKRQVVPQEFANVSEERTASLFNVEQMLSKQRARNKRQSE